MLTASLALGALGFPGTANAQSSWDVPTDQAVSIDHVLTDTHITSNAYAGNVDSAVELFEDYDGVHTAGEKWIFRSIGNRQQFQIQNSGGDFCLQPGDPADATAGKPIVQRACSPRKKSQWWTLTGKSTHDFTIRPYDDDGLAITPATNDRYSQLRLGQTDGAGGHLNQHFRIR